MQLTEADRVRYRCRTGHAYSVLSLVEDARAGVDRALWNAVRALDESRRVMRHASDTLSHHRAEEAAEMLAAAEEAGARAEIVRALAQKRHLTGLDAS